MKVPIILDLGNNEIRNVLVQALSSAPSSPLEARLYYDTTLHQLGYYNGSSWVYLSGGGGTVSSVTGTAPIVSSGGSTPAISITPASGSAAGSMSAADYTTLHAATNANTASTLVQRDASGNFSAGTITAATVTGLSSPTNTTDAANKAYVDAISQGVAWKASVAAATTAALPTNTYSNGSSGVGATLTATANGALTIDGYTVVTGDRILVKNESTGANNGIYTVTNTGGSSAAYVLTRATDNDAATEIAGAAVLVRNGTTNVDQGWIVNSAGPYTLGTTAITWTQFTGVSDITAGTGLTKTGNTLAQDTANGYGLRKYSTTIGDGSSTAIVITHSLATQDVQVQVYTNASPWDTVYPDVERTTTNTCTIRFGSAPASNAYRVVVQG